MTQHSLTTLSNTTATRLTPNGIHSGMDITLQNVNADGYIYVGSSSVSSTNYGFRIMPNHSISFELMGNNSLYAISSVNSMKLAVIQIGLEVGS
jgi:hypothetical protein